MKNKKEGCRAAGAPGVLAPGSECDAPGLAARGDRTGVCIYPPINGERLNSQISAREGSRKASGWSGTRGRPPVKDLQVRVPEFAASCGFGQNHSPESERGEKPSTRSRSPRKQLDHPLASSRSSLTFCAPARPHKLIPLRVPSPRAPPFALRPPPPARGTAPRAHVQTQVIKP